MDLTICFQDQQRIHLESHFLFSEPRDPKCRQFLERTFQASGQTNQFAVMDVVQARMGIEALIDTSGVRTVAQVPTDILQPHSGDQENGQEKNSIPGSSD
jgi:hypothetical protein